MYINRPQSITSIHNKPCTHQTEHFSGSTRELAEAARENAWSMMSSMGLGEVRSAQHGMSMLLVVP
jgi:hypothetical protein